MRTRPLPMRSGFAAVAAMLAPAAIAQAPLPPPRPPELNPPAAPAQPQPSAQPAPAQSPSPAQAQPQAQEASRPSDAEEEGSGGQPSQQAKCEAYRKTFDAVVNRLGRDGLSADFLERNAAFVASNCAGARDVCPRSPQELRVANIIVTQAVGSTGGTFMPFGCAPQQPKQ